MKRLNLPKERTFEGPAASWKRIAAFAIDMLILMYFVLFPFNALFLSFVPQTSSFSEMFKTLNTSSGYAEELSMIAIFMSIPVITYFSVLEKKFGRTIGKHLMKLQVTSESNELKGWQAFARNVVFLPVFPFVILWIVDPLFMLFNKTNQRLSEILTKTRVIEKYKLNEEWQNEQ